VIQHDRETRDPTEHQKLIDHLGELHERHLGPLDRVHAVLEHERLALGKGLIVLARQSEIGAFSIGRDYFLQPSQFDHLNLQLENRKRSRNKEGRPLMFAHQRPLCAVERARTRPQSQLAGMESLSIAGSPGSDVFTSSHAKGALCRTERQRAL
jgi:hypothetical protein